jgi:hypothetical protein
VGVELVGRRSSAGRAARPSLVGDDAGVSEKVTVDRRRVRVCGTPDPGPRSHSWLKTMAAGPETAVSAAAVREPPVQVRMSRRGSACRGVHRPPTLRSGGPPARRLRRDGFPHVPAWPVGSDPNPSNTLSRVSRDCPTAPRETLPAASRHDTTSMDRFHLLTAAAVSAVVPVSVPAPCGRSTIEVEDAS